MTDEERKEMLEWLHVKERTAQFISENNKSQDAQYHARRDLYFFSLICALIEKRTVGPGKLLDWAFKHAAESNVAIIHSDLVSLLAEFGVTLEVKG